MIGSFPKLSIGQRCYLPISSTKRVIINSIFNIQGKGLIGKWHFVKFIYIHIAQYHDIKTNSNKDGFFIFQVCKNFLYQEYLNDTNIMEKNSLRCFSHHLSSNVNLILPYQVTQLSSVLSQHVIYHRLIRHSDQ